jgi:hypothetical protein
LNTQAEALEMDWSGGTVVVARPGFLSGKAALRDDPRVSPDTVVGPDRWPNFFLVIPSSSPLTSAGANFRMAICSPLPKVTASTYC